MGFRILWNLQIVAVAAIGGPMVARGGRLSRLRNDSERFPVQTVDAA